MFPSPHEMALGIVLDQSCKSGQRRHPLKRTAMASLLALALATGALPAAAEDTITFGAAVSLTGKTAKEGEYTRDGYQIALDKINETGGVKVGGKTYKVAMKYYDDESKSERTAQLIEKLINEDKVN